MVKGGFFYIFMSKFYEFWDEKWHFKSRDLTIYWQLSTFFQSYY